MHPSLPVHPMFLLDHILAFIICGIAPIMTIMSKNMTPDDLRFDEEDKIKLYHGNAMLLTVMALIVISVWRLMKRDLASLGFDWPLWNRNSSYLLIAVMLFYALDIFFQYGLKSWRKKTRLQKSPTIMLIPGNARELFHFSFLALAAGIGEEIIFRGFLIQYLIFWTGNSQAGMATACLVGSAIFAFLHGYQGYKSMIKIFFIAMLFSAIFVISQSLLLVIVLHAMIDLLSGALGLMVVRESPNDENTLE